MSQTAGGSNVAKPEEYNLDILSASKNIIHSAKVSSYFRRSEEFGIHKDGSTIDMAAVRDRKRTMVTGLVDIHMENLKNSGAELILGSGRFTGPRTLEVMLPDGKTRQLLGTNVIIGTVEALELDEIHEHLLVIGGGYVGLELAQAMRRFGSRVTLIERNGRLVHQEDEDVAAGLSAFFEDEGIELVLNARTKSVSGTSGHSVIIIMEQDGAERSLKGTHLLVATGRTPNTAIILRAAIM